MRKIQIAFVVLFALAASVRAQVVLNTGDTYTFPFNSIPNVGAGDCSGAAPVGGFTFTLSAESFDARNDVLQFEMFENDTREPALASAVAEAVSDGIAFPAAWADLQGTVRFTMISGSAVLQRLVIFQRTPIDAESCQRYELQVTPTPSRNASRTLISLDGTLLENSAENPQTIQLGARLTGGNLPGLEFAPVEGEGSVKPASRSSSGKAGVFSLSHFDLDGEVIREDQLLVARGFVRSSPDRRLIGARVVIVSNFNETSNEETGLSLYFYPHPSDETEAPIEFYGHGFVTVRHVGGG